MAITRVGAALSKIHEGTRGKIKYHQGVRDFLEKLPKNWKDAILPAFDNMLALEQPDDLRDKLFAFFSVYNQLVTSFVEVCKEAKFGAEDLFELRQFVGTYKPKMKSKEAQMAALYQLAIVHFDEYQLKVIGPDPEANPGLFASGLPALYEMKSVCEELIACAGNLSQCKKQFATLHKDYTKALEKFDKANAKHPPHHAVAEIFTTMCSNWRAAIDILADASQKDSFSKEKERLNSMLTRIVETITEVENAIKDFENTKVIRANILAHAKPQPRVAGASPAPQAKASQTPATMWQKKENIKNYGATTSTTPHPGW